MAQTEPPLSSLLPTEIAGWKATGNDGTYNRSTLFDYIDGGAELFLSYGFKQALNRRYKKEGSPDIVADIFDMATSFNAYGVFSQSMETIDVSFGQGAQISSGLLIFWKDRYYVSLTAHPETVESKNALRTLASLIDGALNSTGPLPHIVHYLPEQELIKESIRYFRNYTWQNAHYFIADNNVFNINEHTEAVLAKYGVGEKRALLLLVSYPDEPSAKIAYHSFIKSYLSNYSGRDAARMADGTYASCRVTGNLVSAVFNAAKSEDAACLLDAVDKKQRLLREQKNESTP